MCNSLPKNFRHILAVIACAVTVVLCPFYSSAQETPYKYSIGAQLGMSGYLGDASSNLFAHPGFTATGDFRYHYDSRWVFGGSLGFQTLSGSTADMDNYLPDGAVYDLQLRYRRNLQKNAPLVALPNSWRGRLPFEQ